MTQTPLVVLEHVGCTFHVKQHMFHFKEYTALKDVTVTINKGETLGIVGSNGAGKSTLLKLIAGILLPTSGNIRFYNEPTVSLLSLNMGFNVELSGRTNAIINAMLIGFSRKEAEARLDKIIAFAELEDWIDDPIKTYSAGMQARLGFGVALEMSPDILLVDEVFGVGDQRFQEKSTAAMREKMASNQTTIFVSHDLHSISALCSRCVWLHDGRTLAEGPPDEIIAHYLNGPDNLQI